jgi:hypothetical protein
MADNNKQVYFVVYYDESDGSFTIDDDRAEAVFDNADVWDDETQEWEGMYEHAELVEGAREKLVNLVSTTWAKSE